MVFLEFDLGKPFFGYEKDIGLSLSFHPIEGFVQSFFKICNIF